MHGTVRRSEFGFTNSKADLDAVVAWREAAIADGWDHAPTYSSHEGEDRACKLNKEGFVAQIISRCPTSLKGGPGKWMAEAQVNVWGPDGMVIRVPDIYDWPTIKAAVETCHYCGAHPVKTQRVAFAGRGCAECAPKEQAKLPRNWCD